MIALNETASGVSFSVRVQPGAKRNAILGEFGEALKIALTAPPVDGRANEACVEFLAGLLDIPQSAVTIVSGHNSRSKIVRVAGLSTSTLRQRLEQ